MSIKFLKSDILKLRLFLSVLFIATFLSSMINFYQLLTFVLTIYLVTGGWRFAKIIICTGKRDIK